ncbi:hypothetical protein BaRGS_00028509 [Batillaria attramentaria]|uniref:PiggyBac transposable element-derived protein domain-containing protein n=1 Tax=Batillaria attramentaria TaxID=370345 RepID=A0ABD0JB41_9CAEN
MCRERFEKISLYLHCNNRETNPPRGQGGHDKLHHVKPLLETISHTCLTSFNPHPETSVDEAIVTFRGRLGIRQYLPAKPTMYEMKVWMQADPQNGYANEFQVYTGKGETGDDGENRRVPLSSRVVLDLTHTIQGQFYTVNRHFFPQVSGCSRN